MIICPQCKGEGKLNEYLPNSANCETCGITWTIETPLYPVPDPPVEDNKFCPRCGPEFTTCPCDKCGLVWDETPCKECGHPKKAHAINVGCQAGPCQCKLSHTRDLYLNENGRFKKGNPGQPHETRHKKFSIRRMMVDLLEKKGEEWCMQQIEQLLTSTSREDAVKAKMWLECMAHVDGKPVESIKHLNEGDRVIKFELKVRKPVGVEAPPALEAAKPAERIEEVIEGETVHADH